MKTLILSDSHGWTDEVAEITARHQDVQAVIHCGDSELSADEKAIQGMNIVAGNCDMHHDFPEEWTGEIGGLRFFVGHGHLLQVKSTEMNLLYKAEEAEADIACFGHTHVAVATEEKGRILINPGSVRLPREYPVGTYVILEEKANAIDVNFYDTSGQFVEELSKTFSKNS
ncbi:metallophosphoesterase [Paenalkalicoccus suaedae]|uniref:Phosphoesterase n=1 Tax=Paenalkalicoccus suaedae TaxID=2592382 RepID=A0A859FIB2_9BACI|nr:metallophosphoesterase [Paenalkalicoccus suaedae]QKS71965.1 metallophosphoesterase [Paenalkalicoccus suaedae]